MGKKAVMASARRLKGKFEERWDFEEVYGQAWRGMGDRAREEIVLRAMECMHLEFEDLSRYSVPEITLGNMAGGSGEGFLKLVNALLPGEDLQGDYSVVRHAGWEVVHGIELDEGESLKPRSRSICAMQKGFLLLRHAYMLDFVLNALKEIKKATSDDPLKTPAKPDTEPFGDGFCMRCATPASRTSSGKLSFCGKCLASGRKVRYCSRECQLADRPSHKATYGKPVSEASSIPLYNTSSDLPSSHLNPFLVRQLHVLDSFREIKVLWIVMHTSYPSDHRMIGVGTGAAGLDLFEAIAGVRDTAIKYKSLTLIGLLALTVAVSAEMEYGIMGGPAEWCTEEIIVEQMAKEFDVGEEELRLAMKDAEPMAPWWIAELIAKEEEESGQAQKDAGANSKT